MQGHRLAATLVLGAVLGGCTWFESLFGNRSDDASAVEAASVAAASEALAESRADEKPAGAADPAAAPQLALLPGYLADFETGLNLGRDLGALPWKMPKASSEPAIAVPPLPARRPAAFPAVSHAAAIVPVALTFDEDSRDVDFAAGARLVGTPLSQVMRTSVTPALALTPLEPPPGQESYSLADALRDAQWRSETARRLETMFR